MGQTVVRVMFRSKHQVPHVVKNGHRRRVRPYNLVSERLNCGAKALTVVFDLRQFVRNRSPFGHINRDDDMLDGDISRVKNLMSDIRWDIVKHTLFKFRGCTVDDINASPLHDVNELFILIVDMTFLTGMGKDRGNADAHGTGGRGTVIRLQPFDFPPGRSLQTHDKPLLPIANRILSFISILPPMIFVKFFIILAKRGEKRERWLYQKKPEGFDKRKNQERCGKNRTIKKGPNRR